jgi:hemoglobin
MFARSTTFRLLAAAFLAFALLASGGARAQTLFDRLGGLPAIECWVDTGLQIIGRDRRINDFFAGELNAGQPVGLRDSLVDFACFATGGGCDYGGREMACAHAGLGIDHDSFTYFLKDLEKAAFRCRRGHTGWMTDPAYSELNKVLLSLRPPIVQDDPGEGTNSCP